MTVMDRHSERRLRSAHRGRRVRVARSFFFFQAEDGIRHFHVTGVQTCALPIWLGSPQSFGALGQRIAECCAAMRAHPYLVAGRNRTDTAVMERSADLLVKSGAEGLACAAAPQAGLGVAVKVADGGERASGPTLIRALELVGALPEAELGELARFARRPVLG